MRCLLLHLEGPLQSYGAEAVDATRPTAEVPGRSMLAGLLGNALGFVRTEPARLQSLEDRISYAARVDRRGKRLRDFHTVQLARSDVMWTAGPERAERSGAKETYDNPHIRLMDYHADRVCVVALALADGQGPSLDEVAAALARPRRPLFLGRKTCLPSAPILGGIREGRDPLDVLRREPIRARCDSKTLLVQVDGEETDAGWRRLSVTDSCEWHSRIFGGGRRVSQAHLPISEFPPALPEAA